MLFSSPISLDKLYSSIGEFGSLRTFKPDTFPLAHSVPPAFLRVHEIPSRDNLFALGSCYFPREWVRRILHPNLLELPFLTIHTGWVTNPNPAAIWELVLPDLILPGHQATVATRIPPS
jgi:hypothetical protein